MARLKPWQSTQWREMRGQRTDCDLCCHCGKPLKTPARHMVEVVLGGEYVRHDTPDVAALRDQNDYMAYFPVGPDCARRLRKDGVVIEEV